MKKRFISSLLAAGVVLNSSTVLAEIADIYLKENLKEPKYTSKDLYNNKEALEKIMNDEDKYAYEGKDGKIYSMTDVVEAYNKTLAKGLNFGEFLQELESYDELKDDDQAEGKYQELLDAVNGNEAWAKRKALEEIYGLVTDEEIEVTIPVLAEFVSIQVMKDPYDSIYEVFKDLEKAIEAAKEDDKEEYSLEEVLNLLNEKYNKGKTASEEALLDPVEELEKLIEEIKKDELLEGIEIEFIKTGNAKYGEPVKKALVSTVKLTRDGEEATGRVIFTVRPESLVIKELRKELQNLVDKFEKEYEHEREKYTEKSYSVAYIEKYEAVELLKKPDAKIKEIESKVNSLSNAINSLEEKSEAEKDLENRKKELEEKIAKTRAEADKEKYTNESYKAFEDKLMVIQRDIKDAKNLDGLEGKEKEIEDAKKLLKLKSEIVDKIAKDALDKAKEAAEKDLDKKENLEAAEEAVKEAEEAIDKVKDEDKKAELEQELKGAKEKVEEARKNKNVKKLESLIEEFELNHQDKRDKYTEISYSKAFEETQEAKDDLKTVESLTNDKLESRIESLSKAINSLEEKSEDEKDLENRKKELEEKIAKTRAEADREKYTNESYKEFEDKLMVIQRDIKDAKNLGDLEGKEKEIEVAKKLLNEKSLEQIIDLLNEKYNKGREANNDALLEPVDDLRDLKKAIQQDNILEGISIEFIKTGNAKEGKPVKNALVSTVKLTRGEEEAEGRVIFTVKPSKEEKPVDEEEAEEAVNKAEESKDREDFDNAKDLVDKLEDGEKKDELNNKLEELEKEIKEKELEEIKEAKKKEIDEIELTDEEKEGKTEESITEAENKLNELKKAAKEKVDEAETVEKVNKVEVDKDEALGLLEDKVVDKTKLKEALDNINDRLEKLDFKQNKPSGIDKKKTEIEEKLKEAKNLLEDENAKQEEVDKEVENLNRVKELVTQLEKDNAEASIYKATHGMLLNEELEDILKQVKLEEVKGYIKGAFEDFESLSDGAKELLKVEKEKLEDLKNKLEEIENEAAEKALEESKEAKKKEIDNIELSYEDKVGKTEGSIKTAEEKLKELKETAKKEVDQAKTLEDVNKVEVDKDEALGLLEDKEVKEVEGKIDNLPGKDELTLDNKKDVEYARDAYDKLNDDQKELVDKDKKDKLEELENKLEDLEKQVAEKALEEAKEIYNNAVKEAEEKEINIEDEKLENPEKASKDELEEATNSIKEKNAESHKLQIKIKSETGTDNINKGNFFWGDLHIENAKGKKIFTITQTEANSKNKNEKITKMIEKEDRNYKLTLRLPKENEDYYILDLILPKGDYKLFYRIIGNNYPSNGYQFSGDGEIITID